MNEKKRHGHGSSREPRKECNEDGNELLLPQVKHPGSLHRVVPVDGQQQVTNRATGHWKVLKGEES